jgi:hypothetical protein
VFRLVSLSTADELDAAGNIPYLPSEDIVWVTLTARVDFECIRDLFCGIPFQNLVSSTDAQWFEKYIKIRIDIDALAELGPLQNQRIHGVAEKSRFFRLNASIPLDGDFNQVFERMNVKHT